MELGTYKVIRHPNQHKGKFMWRIKKFFIRLLKLIGSMAIIATLIVLYAQFGTPEHVVAITTVLEDKTEFPVLQRIAGCESEGNRASHGSQYDSKGRLRMNVNKDGTVDIGKNMINTYFWELKAVELGYNIYTEEGNDAMAKWIYLNKGTGDWSASMKCWK